VAKEAEGPPEPKARAKTILRLVAGAAISIAFMVLAFRGVDWSGAWKTLASSDAWLLLLALLSVVATASVKALRWRLMYYPEQRRIRRHKALTLFWVGQVINAVIPLRVGEVARAYLMRRSEGVGMASGLWTAVLEKVLDTLVLLLVIAVLALWIPLPDWLRSSSWTLTLAVLIGLVVLALAILYQPKVVCRLTCWEADHPWWARLRLGHLVGVVGDCVRQLRSPWVSVGLLLWSLLAFLAAALTNWLTARALGLELSMQASLLLLAVLQISAVVPLPTSPGRIGVFHYLCVITLAIFGMGRSEALTFGLILHVLVYLPMTVAGPLAIWNESVPWSVLRRVGQRVEGVAEASD